MSRYRPPQVPASPYITADGASRLRAELRQLWKVERPQVTATVHEAAKNGDRSENGDYIYGKRRLREIDRRVRYLTGRLEELIIVDRHPTEQHKIFFGAWVTLNTASDATKRYRIVGSDEVGFAPEHISIDSPVARALLGKHVGDSVEVIIGVKRHSFRVLTINYAMPVGQ